MPSLMYILNSEKLIRNVFIKFYVVGFLLFALPFSREIFIRITSLSLLFVFGIVFYFHKKWNYSTIFWFIFIAVSSFFIEMEGVRGGNIFGAYSYNIGLAPLLNGTPLIIGLNWLFLTYATHNISLLISRNVIVRVLLAASLMIIYDVLMEQVAPFMKMWEFTDNTPPLSNYIAWFIISIVYLCGFEFFKINSLNYTARIAFVIQFFFFILIFSFSKFFLI